MDARFYNSEEIDIERLASDLEQKYRMQGYEVQSIGNKDQMMVQLKKGGALAADCRSRSDSTGEPGQPGLERSRLVGAAAEARSAAWPYSGAPGAANFTAVGAAVLGSSLYAARLFAAPAAGRACSRADTVTLPKLQYTL